MKKILILFLLFSIVGCSKPELNEVKDIENVENANKITHLPIIQSGFVTTQNESYEFLGEIGEFGVLKKTFKVDVEDTYTWILWGDDKNKLDEMVGQEVKLYGINEKTNEKEFLAASTIEELSEDDPEVPESNLSLKFNTYIKPTRKGKWQVDSYVDNNLIGTIIIYVEGKDEF